jgi:signal peptidase II
LTAKGRKDREGLGNFLIVLIVVAIDQLTKFFSMRLDGPVRLLPFLQLNLQTNTGAGWSLFTGHNGVLIFVIFAVIGFLMYKYDTFRKIEKPFVSLIIGGAIGNLIDRLAHGFVVDFIDFLVWPVFNLADTAVSIGIIGLIIISFKKN